MNILALFLFFPKLFSLSRRHIRDSQWKAIVSGYLSAFVFTMREHVLACIVHVHKRKLSPQIIGASDNDVHSVEIKWMRSLAALVTMHGNFGWSLKKSTIAFGIPLWWKKWAFDKNYTHSASARKTMSIHKWWWCGDVSTRLQKPYTLNNEDSNFFLFALHELLKIKTSKYESELYICISAISKIVQRVQWLRQCIGTVGW